VFPPVLLCLHRGLSRLYEWSSSASSLRVSGFNHHGTHDYAKHNASNNNDASINNNASNDNHASNNNNNASNDNDASNNNNNANNDNSNHHNHNPNNDDPPGSV